MVYWANIPPTEFAAGTTYYVSITNDTSRSDALWVWEEDFPGNGFHVRFDFGDGFGDWTEEPGTNLAFALYTNRTDDDD